MDNVIDQIGQIVGGYMPHLAGALAILIFGWLAARVVAAIVRCHRSDHLCVDPHSGSDRRAAVLGT